MLTMLLEFELEVTCMEWYTGVCRGTQCLNGNLHGTSELVIILPDASLHLPCARLAILVLQRTRPTRLSCPASSDPLWLRTSGFPLGFPCPTQVSNDHHSDNLPTLVCWVRACSRSHVDQTVPAQPNVWHAHLQHPRRQKTLKNHG